MREPNKEATRWLKQAESDLAYAELGLREGFFAQVCFQCQQVCEKAVKAIRYGRGERAVLGHALVELAASLTVMEPFREGFAVLDQYYVPTRYPNGLPGGVPSDVYTRAQAAGAVDIACQVLAVVRTELDPSVAEQDVSAVSGEEPEGGHERTDRGDDEASPAVR